MLYIGISEYNPAQWKWLGGTWKSGQRNSIEAWDDGIYMRKGVYIHGLPLWGLWNWKKAMGGRGKIGDGQEVSSPLIDVKTSVRHVYRWCIVGITSEEVLERRGWKEGGRYGAMVWGM
jgi:hypothetical protein